MRPSFANRKPVAFDPGQGQFLLPRHHLVMMNLAEGIMPITSVFIVGAIVLAFVVFAAALAWSEHQTRHWRQSAQSVPEKEPEIRHTSAAPQRQRDLRPV